MLILKRIEIENFVCFDKIEIKPSTDPERPLTVIRAENGSGKTTLLRALRWGMYGEKGLPGEQTSRFSLHPAWWQPNETGIETRVAIEFLADGSSRHHTTTKNDKALYRLDRTVKTIKANTSKDHEPDFRRINDHSILMIRGIDGMWESHEKGVDTVIEELLPWGLRDFFVMDTDEATDFVGGSENKIISRQEVQDKTTKAITSLLGIDVFKEARKRVENIAHNFSKQATKAIGDHDLDQMQIELEQARSEHKELSNKINDEKQRETELSDKCDYLNNELEQEIRKSGSYDGLDQRLSANRTRCDKAIKARNDCLARLVDDLESIDLLAPLASSAIVPTYEFLKPLHDNGEIPLAHLPFVQGLMKSGTCVCGQILLTDNKYGRNVQQLIEEASNNADRADFLHHLHDATKSLALSAETSTWNNNREKNTANLSELENEIAGLKAEHKDLTTKLDEIEEDKIQMLRDEKQSVEHQLQLCRRRVQFDQQKVPELENLIASLDKTIHQRQRNKREADDYRASETVAQCVVTILDKAYSAIEKQQVSELCDRVNRLFHQMAANVSDNDFAEVHPNKATLRMIAHVGVRTIEGSPDKFEVFALNSRNRSMPPVEINGASRRVMALAFILALCDESQTRAPLIADSLLNFMSGAVRRNTLRVTSEHSNQPILLLTNADLEATSEVEIVSKYGGATYTLTGQWDAIDAGGSGDVLHWTEQRQVTLLCTCGPRQYCKICERSGQAGAPGWTERPN
ncbi:MAG: AAA family ATPase [bacterium]|nr:AAA family ATPase [bacterium]